MFSKKMLLWTLVSLIFSLTYEKLLTLPESYYRPLLILALLLSGLAWYAYRQGYFSEDKIVDTIVRHQDDPLSHIHAPLQEKGQQNKAKTNEQ